MPMYRARGLSIGSVGLLFSIRSMVFVTPTGRDHTPPLRVGSVLDAACQQARPGRSRAPRCTAPGAARNSREAAARRLCAGHDPGSREGDGEGKSRAFSDKQPDLDDANVIVSCSRNQLAAVLLKLGFDEEICCWMMDAINEEMPKYRVDHTSSGCLPFCCRPTLQPAANRKLTEVNRCFFESVLQVALKPRFCGMQIYIWCRVAGPPPLPHSTNRHTSST